MRKSNRQFFLTVLLAAVVVLSACNRKTAYHHFEHTPQDGWEKSDTLFFNISPIKESGQYREELGLRLNGRFPFMSLQLTVDQVVFPVGHLQHDTLTCSLITHGGQPKGDGISLFQYSFPVTSILLNKGDSLCICVRHNMKREMLIGIDDIGIKLVKE